MVCASSKGLGRGCAEALAAEGVNLVLNARGSEALEATAEANNRNALAASTRSYKKNMDGVAGPRSRFVAERRLDEWHQYSYASALAHFVTKANMGSRVQIATFPQQLEGEVAA